jgi:hypothetical protein
MPEKAFESKFNQLVQNELSQKFPAALPARIGFQLVDRQDMPDGGEKAVGVTALKVNDVRAYIPSIFQDNEIKGLDLMWLYEPDLFVPANGAWLSRLSDVGTQMPSIGQRLRKDEEASSNAPDETIISHSFLLGGKTAERAEPRRRLRDVPMDHVVDVRSLLLRLPGFGTDKTAETLAHPDVANPLLARFGQDYLFDLMADCGFCKHASMQDPEACASVKGMSKVMVVDGLAAEGAELLSEAEKKVLLKNEAYVKDDRDPASLAKLYRCQPNSSMKTPDKSGLYDLMTSEGGTRRCLVVFGSSRKRDGMAGDCEPAAGSRALVVPLDDAKAAWEIDSHDMFGTPLQAIGPDDDKELGAKADDGVHDIEGQFYLLQPHRWVRLTQNRDFEGNSRNTFWVTMDDGTSGSAKVRFTGRAGKPTLVGGVLFVPSDARVVKAKKEPHDLTTWSASSAILFKEAGCRPLRVGRLAGGWQISIDGERPRTLDKVAALKRLAIDMNLFGGEAQMLLKESERKGVVDYMYKQAAQDVGDLGATPYSIRTPTTTRRTQQPKGISPSPETVSSLQRAAEDGDEDVFEIGILKQLLSAADASELDKDVLDEITGAMDACGRKLYKLYWHGDAHREQYGATDLKELENKLRMLFQELGSAVLLLQDRKAGKAR